MTTTSVWRCFVDRCEGKVVLTRSWAGGDPTKHACQEHATLLARVRTASGSPSVMRQGVLT